MKNLKFLLFFVIVLTGFSSITEEALASTYPSAVAWITSYMEFPPRKLILKTLAMRLERLNF